MATTTVRAVVYICSRCGHNTTHKSNMKTHVSRRDGPCYNAAVLEGEFRADRCGKDCSFSISQQEGGESSQAADETYIACSLRVKSLDDHRLELLLDHRDGHDIMRQVYNALVMDGVGSCFSTFVKLCLGKEACGSMRCARVVDRMHIEWGCDVDDVGEKIVITRRRLEWRSIMDFLLQAYDTFVSLCVTHPKSRHDIPRDIRESAELLEEDLPIPIFKRTTREYTLLECIQSRRRNPPLERLVNHVVDALS